MSTKTHLLVLLTAIPTSSYGLLAPHVPLQGDTQPEGTGRQDHRRSPSPLEGVLPLHTAIATGQMSTVRQLVQEEACDVNAQDKEGNTPLHVALLRGDAQGAAFAELCKHEALQPNLYNRAFRSPLDLMPEGYPHRQAFLERGAHTGVLACMQANDVNGFLALLGDEEYDHQGADKEGNTPLHWAALWGVDALYIETLIDYGAAVNPLNHARQTPLDGLPAQHPLYPLLVRAGALHGEVAVPAKGEVCLPDEEDKATTAPPPAVAFRQERKEATPPPAVPAVEEPRQCFDHLTRAQRQVCFLQACQKGDAPTAAALLPSIDPNFPGEGGRTPLYYACWKGHLAVVQALLQEERVDPRIANSWGSTPFYIACYLGHPEVVRALLQDRRTDPMTANKSGWTPFYSACARGHLEVVQILLQKECIDPSQAPTSGLYKSEPPLYIACVHRHLEVVHALLKSPRIDPMAAKDNGATPFYIACQHGHEEVVNALLQEERVDPNQPANSGFTPLAIAKRKGHRAIIKRLEEAGIRG